MRASRRREARKEIATLPTGLTSIRTPNNNLNMISFVRFLLLGSVLAACLCHKSVWAQEDFGNVLLTAFTSGIFNGEGPGQEANAPTAPSAPLSPGSSQDTTGSLPQVSLEPLEVDVEITGEPSTEASPEESTEETMTVSEEPSAETFVESSPELSVEEFAELPGQRGFELEEPPQESTEFFGEPAFVLEESPEESAEISGEPAFEMEESPEEFPEISSEPALDMERSPEESTEESMEESPEDSLEPSMEAVDSTSREFASFIRVNAGSFEETEGFEMDTNAWYTNTSKTVDDPFAGASFETMQDSLVYSTYRYTTAGDLQYTVPVNATGFWKVTLHWAEISEDYNQEGDRVFSVSFRKPLVRFPLASTLVYYTGHVYARANSFVSTYLLFEYLGKH